MPSSSTNVPPGGNTANTNPTTSAAVHTILELIGAAEAAPKENESQDWARLHRLYPPPQQSKEYRVELVESGTVDLSELKTELDQAHENVQICTRQVFENDRVRVWEFILDPGYRHPFHAHKTNYFWTVIEGGRGRGRLADGRYEVYDYQVGDTKFLTNTEDDYLIHDLENIGDTRLRFITVELLS